MSIAGLLIISVQGLTDLPPNVRSAVVMVRVLSRKERRVPRCPETITSTATVSEDGVVTFEGNDPHIEVYTPFPREDVVRVHVATGPREEPFGAAPLIRVSVMEKNRHLERSFALTNPKTKEASGTLKLVINYVPPTVDIPEDVLAEKLRATAAPGKTMTFKQALTVLQDVDKLTESAKVREDASSPKPEEPEEEPPEEPTEEPPEEPQDPKEKSEDKRRDDSKSSKSKKHSHHSHRKKGSNNAESSSTKSGESSSSGKSSRHNSVPPVSADELTAAMNAESDGMSGTSSSSSSTSSNVVVPSLKIVAHSAADSRDIMLGPTPRHQRESLKNVVEARGRVGSGSSKTVERIEKKPASRGDGIVVTPCENLSFGLNCRQASLETDLIEPVKLENKSSKTMCFRFLLKNNDHPKYSIYAEPEMGKLKPGQTMDVTIKLVIHCTTHLRLSLPMAMWKGHTKDYDTASVETISLTAGVQSKLSTKLDSEEVEIFRPPIGSGAFGTVYRGKYRGFEVAVKVLKDQANPSPDLMEAFESEVEMAEALRHTSIVNFVGAVHFKNQLAIVTEFCPFGDLNSALKKYPFPYPLKLKALLDASRAMDYLHQSGMIHRDLKTENLLVVSLEALSQTVCKLSDFGTARGLNSFAQQKSMNLTKGVGTPIFMAPEILSGSQNYAESCDVYSFGVMMCHVANNELPYSHDRRFDSSYQFVQKVIGGMRPELKVPDLAEDYKKLMSSCWDKNPQARPPFSDISDMLEDMFFAERSSLPSASILQN